jgi:hypothetical protein
MVEKRLDRTVSIAAISVWLTLSSAVVNAKDQAPNWPADYHARCWQQFLPLSAINERTVPSIKVRSATK